MDYKKLTRDEMILEKDRRVISFAREAIQCSECGTFTEKKWLSKNLNICNACGKYFRIDSRERINMIADKQSFIPWLKVFEENRTFGDCEYMMKLQATREKTGLDEALIIGCARIYGERFVIGVFNFNFLSGSMGYTVGERIARAFETAIESSLPVVIFCCSGGARIQEGIVSLMQMAKTAAAVKKHSDAGLLFISVLTDPTTGGVTASIGMAGDIILAEPNAMIGFAGPRVISQTLGSAIPEGVQTAEFLVRHGMIDGIIERRDIKSILFKLIKAHSKSSSISISEIFHQYNYQPSELAREKQVYSNPLTAWQKVRSVRQMKRPSAFDYIGLIFDYFIEFHGDRHYGDDKAIIGGLAFLKDYPVTVIAEDKGKELKEAVERNGGMPMPEGYRKALRLMKQAEKFNRPIISFINTPGAFCGLEAEERGQAEAIAKNLVEMSGLKVPVLCIIIGEGGSGGALATAVGNEVWMLENAVYSVLSPEGYASIRWKDHRRAQEAVEMMGLTAQELLKDGFIEKIIPEFGGADSNTVKSIAGYIKKNMLDFLVKYEGKTGEEIAEMRYVRFRNM